MKTAMEQLVEHLAKGWHDNEDIVGILDVVESYEALVRAHLEKAFNAGVESEKSTTVNFLGEKLTFNTYFKTTYNEKD